MDHIEQLQKQVKSLQGEIRELIAKEMKPLSKDYTFDSVNGQVKLSNLFGEQQELIVIHNMGISCPYCTAFADGINGILHYLNSRCEVVLESSDPVDIQQDVVKKRRWKFKVLSTHKQGDAFSKDMGICGHHAEPGFSVFYRDNDGKVERVSYSQFDDGDEFCPVFPILEHLRGGIGDWSPSQNLLDAK